MPTRRPPRPTDASSESRSLRGAYIHVRLSADLKAEFQSRCDSEARSSSKLLRAWIEAWLSEKPAPIKPRGERP